MKNLFLVVFLVFIVLAASGTCPGQEEEAAGEKPAEISTLVDRLADSDEAVRLRARADLVGRGEAAGPALVKALEGADDQLADGLIEILALIRYRPAAAAVEKIWQNSESIPVKMRAAQALCRFDHNYNRYQGYLLSQVRSGREEDRMTAMQLLGYIEDARVVAPLVGIFNDTGQSDQIRQAAIWDLAHTPVRESAEALVSMVNDASLDWFYKEIVIAALRLLAGQEEMAPIVSELLERSQGIPRR